MSEQRITAFADWAAAVKQRIAERGETYGDVEHRAGLGEGYLSKLLNEHKEPRWPTMAKVNAAVGLEFSLNLVL